MESIRYTKITDIVLLIFFVACIVTPGVIMIAKKSEDVSNQEKRTRTPLPQFSVSTYARGVYQDDFENYFNDHFGARDTLVAWDSLMLYSVFRTSSSDKVLVGNSGWLFYSAENMIDDYIHGNSLSNADLQSIAEFLEQRKQHYDSKGIKFVVFVSPDKETVYSAYMPKRIPSAHNLSTREAFVSYMRGHSSVLIIDPTDTLIKKSADEILYRSFDSHWNEIGASIAYTPLHEYLASTFGIQDIFDSKFTVQDPEEHDIAKLLFIDDRISEQVPVSTHGIEPFIRERYTRNDNDVMEIEDVQQNPCIKAVMLRDSFGIQLLPFLSQDVCALTVLRDYDDLEFVDQQAPDVVILQIVERNIPRLRFREKASPR